MSLLYIGQQYTIYVGCFLFIAGIIGNTMNIFIFSTVRAYRTNPSSFYLLGGSIANTIFILFNLSNRILSGGYGIDLSSRSVIWCKLRNYSVIVLALISFTCSCLATIDQFFVTSRSVRLRRCSNIKWSHRIAFVVILVWCLHGIPVILYEDIIPPQNTCSYTNAEYLAYTRLYVLIFQFIIPVPITIIFGLLTYMNIHQTIVLAEQHVDRQLVKITLIQVVHVAVSIVPYGIYLTYNLITRNISKSIDRLMNEAFVETILILITYVYYVGNFYMFFISSSRFRQKAKDRILWWQRSNQIYPHHT